MYKSFSNRGITLIVLIITIIILLILVGISIAAGIQNKWKSRSSSRDSRKI